MSKTANCIHMLQLLMARGVVRKETLAEELGVNLRNISEYRKELEDAGYDITITSGLYGGYSLNRGTLLPICSFSEKENKAMKEALSYLDTHHDFYLYEEYAHAIDKVFASNTTKLEHVGVYLHDDRALLSEEVLQMIQEMEEARKKELVVTLEYKSMYAQDFVPISIHPYEILNYKGSYYCLAYSLKAKAFRNYKFSKERMRNILCTQKGFTRDLDFQVRDHIGSLGLIQHEVYELDLLIEKEQALLMAERLVGLNPSMEWVSPQLLHYTTIMEGKIETISFLLSLGSQCKVLQPDSLRKEIEKIVQEMLRNYTLTAEI